jgi:TolB protein
MLMVVELSPAGATFPGQNGKIVYEHDDGNDYEIYTISPTGDTPLKVTDNHKHDDRPAYSPNGKRIVYAAHKGATDSELYKIYAAGGTPVKHTSNGSDDRYPSWGSRSSEK